MTLLAEITVYGLGLWTLINVMWSFTNLGNADSLAKERTIEYFKRARGRIVLPGERRFLDEKLQEIKQLVQDYPDNNYFIEVQNYLLSLKAAEVKYGLVSPYDDWDKWELQHSDLFDSITKTRLKIKLALEDLPELQD